MQSLHNEPMKIDSDWFRARAKTLGKTQETLAVDFGRDRSVISRLLDGKLAVKLDHIKTLARAFQVSPFEILYRCGFWEEGVPRVVSAPILNSVEAGRFVETEPDRPPHGAGGVLVEYPSDKLFALEVSGDSMDRVAPDGSIIIVDYSRKLLRDGDLCVVRRDGEATFKRFRADLRGPWLEPDSNNPRHAPIMPAEGEQIEVVGLVVDIRPEYGSGNAKPIPLIPRQKGGVNPAHSRKRIAAS